MFEITVSRQFNAIHALGDCGGGRETPHSHEWRCDVTIGAHALDDLGLVIDFAKVDAAIDKALVPLSGNILKGDEFTGISPSAENVALYIYRKISVEMNDDKRRVSRVVVWEDANHGASYSE